jgi:hypothetical protein
MHTSDIAESRYDLKSSITEVKENAACLAAEQARPVRMREKRVDRVVEDPVGMGGVVLEICLTEGQESVHAFGARRVVTDVFMEEVSEESVSGEQ